MRLRPGTGLEMRLRVGDGCSLVPRHCLLRLLGCEWNGRHAAAGKRLRFLIPRRRMWNSVSALTLGRTSRGSGWRKTPCGVGVCSRDSSLRIRMTGLNQQHTIRALRNFGRTPIRLLQALALGVLVTNGHCPYYETPNIIFALLPHPS